MDSSPARERVRPLVTGLSVVCVAFALSQVFYMGIAWYLLGPSAMEPPAPGLSALVGWTVAALAVGLVLMAPVVQSTLVRQAREQGVSLDERLQRYRAAAVVGYGMREGSGVVGLVLSLLTGDLRWSLGLGLLGILALLAAWPRIGPVEEWVVAAAGQADAETVSRSGHPRQGA